MSSRLLDLHTTDAQKTTVTRLPESTARLPLLDRASLRLGLWLLLRSAGRARHHSDHAVRTRLLTLERDRRVREAAALRLLHLAPRQ